ncbi:DUF6660 family protein [Desertivirga xinjiangensis]|uniref:DUF6660 family protein n=1 Tax=Desertivirga xinjiangensis TaxID=539206 RepID=UPI0034E1F200
MKWISFIISVYVLLLAVSPCCATEHLNASGDECLIEQREADCSKDPDCKGCSPFFSCSSCSGFMIYCSVVFVKPVVSFSSSKKYSLYTYFCLQDICLPIWQPPRLV